MQIISPHSSLPAARDAGVPARAQTQQRAAPPKRRGADTLEVSTMANLLSKQSEAGNRIPASGVRTGLVDRVRGEISAGTYDTPEKLDIALDRMIDELL